MPAKQIDASRPTRPLTRPRSSIFQFSTILEKFRDSLVRSRRFLADLSNKRLFPLSRIRSFEIFYVAISGDDTSIFETQLSSLLFKLFMVLCGVF